MSTPRSQCCLWALALATVLLPAVAMAQLVFVSPLDDGLEGNLPQTILPGSQASLFLYYRTGPIATSLGTLCASGDGDEFCAVALETKASGTVTLLGFQPEPGRDIAYSLAPDRLELNLLDVSTPQVGTHRLGELRVAAAPLLCAAGCEVRGISAQAVRADLVPQDVPIAGGLSPLMIVPEPRATLALGIGLLWLLGLSIRQRNGQTARAVEISTGLILLVAVGLIGARPASAQSQIFDTDIRGAALPSGTLSLTYDDGPGRNTLAIAQYLHSQGIRATFFVNGCRFFGRPGPDPILANTSGKSCETWNPVDPGYYAGVLEQILDLGHRIGNHSQDHVNLTAICPGPACLAQLTEQVAPLQHGLERHIRDGLYSYRPSFLGWNPGAAAAMRIAAPQLIAPVDRDISAADYACLDEPLALNGNPPSNPSTTPQDCAQRYLDAIGTSEPDHGMILLHDRESETEIAGLTLQTTETLDLTVHLVQGLQAAGYHFVPIDAISPILGPRRFETQSLWTSEYSDAEGWNGSVGYYGSVRLVDVNGDGRADYCGRGNAGLWCVESTGSAFFGPPPSDAYLWSSAFSNANGWLPEQYGTTIQFGDIDGDGDFDVCGRFIDGIRCGLGNPGTRSFSTPTLWSSDFSDAQGWDGQPGYYGSIRLADVDGDGRDDVCGRGSAGLWCASSTGSGFGPTTQRVLDDFTNSYGWLPDEHGSTIIFGDLDADGDDDVCGRAGLGLRCALARPDGTYDPTTFWIRAFTDEDEFDTSRSWYRSLGLVDVNGDGRADVCGRAATGIACAYSNGGGFVDYQYLVNDHWTDATGWAPEEYGSTIVYGDIDGDGLGDVCGRAIAGVRCGLAAEALRADADSDGVYDLDDDCPFKADPAQTDTAGLGPGSGPDGRGDPCQCGDLDEDGGVTQNDLDILRAPSTNLAAYAERCSVFAGTLAGTECDLVDAVVMKRALLGLEDEFANACEAAVR